MSELFTIHSDASWYHKHAVGAWGVCSFGHGARKQAYSGLCDPRCTSASDAEFYAVRMAVQHALVIAPKVYSIQLWSDCEGILGWCHYPKIAKTPKSTYACRIQNDIFDMLRKSKVTLVPMWVRSHQDEGVSVHCDRNNMADKLATAEMKRFCESKGWPRL